MNRFRIWLLRLIAGKRSVLMNVTFYPGDRGITIYHRIQEHTVIEIPAMEVSEGFLISGCTFNHEKAMP